MCGSKERKPVHDLICPSRWCVTRQDLYSLRCEVARAISEGSIVPCELDKFDPEDRTFGPSIHTVNEQLIKPVTALAGNASWALMKHPDGLECDLFISHAWQEGIFELIDKVLTSWPRGATHAYCCVLANPQNLDIAGLIDNPRDSPFAQALASAKWVLVVPNRKCSVYTRIWCTYEVYLAYKLRKRIYTAHPPTTGFWRRLPPLLFVFVTATTISLLICTLSSHPPMKRLKVYQYTLAASIWGLIISVSAEMTILKRTLNILIAASFGVNRGITFSLMLWNWGEFVEHLPSHYHALHFFLYIPSVLLVCAASELDCILRIAEMNQSSMLRNGYSGHVMEATSSVREDADKIMSEIGDSGEENAVDRAVDVLINAGMSTPGLQSVAACGIDTTGAAYCNYAKLIFSLVWWLHSTTWGSFGQGVSNTELRSSFIALLQGIAFTISLPFMPRDRRRFAARAVSTWIFPCIIINEAVRLYSGAFIGVIKCTFLSVPVFPTLVTPLALSALILGPGGLLRLPIFGKFLTQWIFCNPAECCRRSLRVSSHSPDREVPLRFEVELKAII